MKKPSKSIARGEDLNTQVGKRVRQFRHILNLSQATLASKISVSYQQLQKYETGVDNMSVNMLERISRSLDEEVGGLVGDEGHRKQYLDIVKLIMNKAEDAPSPKALQSLGDICSFLAQPEAREISQAFVKLVKALDESRAEVEAS